MTVAEYAEEIGISAATLYQWRRRLAPGSEAPRSSRAGFGLVEVTVGGAAAEPEPDSAESFVVRVAGDRAIEVPRGFGDAELRRLVRVLESC